MVKCLLAFDWAARSQLQLDTGEGKTLTMTLINILCFVRTTGTIKTYYCIQNIKKQYSDFLCHKLVLVDNLRERSLRVSKKNQEGLHCFSSFKREADE
jgi:hypothetical protein